MISKQNRNSRMIIEPYSIRPVRPPEVDSVLRLVRETPGFDMGFYQNSEWLRREWEAAVSDWDKNNGMTGAFIHDSLIKGMMRYAILPKTPGEGRIINLGVHPDSQRTGIGKLLLRDGFERLRALGCSSASLGVKSSNQRARDFYLAQGGTEQPQDPRTQYIQYEWDL